MTRAELEQRLAELHRIRATIPEEDWHAEGFAHEYIDVKKQLRVRNRLRLVDVQTQKA